MVSPAQASPLPHPPLPPHNKAAAGVASPRLAEIEGAGTMTTREYWRAVGAKHGVSEDAVFRGMQAYEEARAMISSSGHMSQFGRSLIWTFQLKGIFPESVCTSYVAARHRLPLHSAPNLLPDVSAINRLGIDRCNRWLVCPLDARSNNAIGQRVVVVADPDIDQYPTARAQIGMLFGVAVEYRIASVDAITKALMLAQRGDTQQFSPSASSAAGATGAVQRAVASSSIAQSEEITRETVERDFEKAFNAGASDIHVESTESGLRVRWRVDGRLMEARRITGEAQRAAYLAQVKLSSSRDANGLDSQTETGRASGMDSNQYIRGEDATSVRLWGGRRVSLRYSGSPSGHKYSITIRLNDQTRILGMRLSHLGYRLSVEKALIAAFADATGLNAILGTTGSGKSTTLYCGLKEMDLESMKVITVEDPIETLFSDGLDQREVTPNMPFNEMLRQILRQDPDVVVPAEIRDAESLMLSIRAAQSGHGVFTTLHTDTPHDAIRRILDSAAGIEPGALAPSLGLFCAQRLLRRVCVHCRVPHPNAAEMWEKHAALAHLHETDFRALLAVSGNPIPEGAPLKPAIYASRKTEGGGMCPFCHGRGEIGRIVCTESFRFDDQDKIRIQREGTAYDPVAARADAIREGRLCTMREDAILKALAGIITPEEAIAETKAQTVFFVPNQA